MSEGKTLRIGVVGEFISEIHKLLAPARDYRRYSFSFGRELALLGSFLKLYLCSVRDADELQRKLRSQTSSTRNT